MIQMHNPNNRAIFTPAWRTKLKYVMIKCKTPYIAHTVTSLPPPPPPPPHSKSRSMFV